MLIYRLLTDKSGLQETSRKKFVKKRQVKCRTWSRTPPDKMCESFTSDKKEQQKERKKKYEFFFSL